MKTGRSLQAVATEIQETARLRRDLIAPGSAITMTANANEIYVGENQVFEVGPAAHSNISRRLGIPKQYYDRMLVDAPELLAQNVNCWMDQSNRHMVRTLDGPRPVCRAVLSDRYRVMDNDFVMEGIFPALQKEPGMEVVSTEITDNRFYLKARFPTLEREIKVGDAVQSGVVVTNSEVGFGSVSVSMLIFRLICKNGMKVAHKAFSARKNHIGRVLEHDDDFQVIASDQTLELANKAFLSQLTDIVKAAADPDIFHEVVSSMQDAAGREIKGHVEDVIERVTKQYSLTVDEGKSVLDNLIQGGDTSQYGLSNAITRMSQDIESYDRATDLEAIGGRVVDLNENEWFRLAA